MSSRPSSRACVPWGVSSFLSCCFIACSYCSHLVSSGVSSLISFHRLVLLARLVSSYRVPRGRLVISLFRRPFVSSCRLAVASCLPVSFLFIRLIVLLICDEAFLRGRRAIRIIPMSVRLVRSVLVRPGSVRRSLPSLRYLVMRRREDGKAWVRTAR